MKKINSIFLCLCLIYFVSAIFINCFGQASLSMMQFLSISQAKQGMILTYQAIAGILTALFLSAYGESFSKKKTILIGVLCVSIGTISVFLSTFLKQAYIFIFLSLMISNVGYTTIDLTMNSLISQLYKDEKNKYIPIIHIFFGLGAMLTPSFYLVFINNVKTKVFAYAYLTIGVVSAILSLIFIKSNKNLNDNCSKQNNINDPFEVFKDKKTWYLLIIAILYTIYQNSFSSWIADYNISYRKLNANISSIIVTFYFAGALLMRLFSTKLLNKITVENYYFIFGIVSSLLLLSGFISTTNTLFYITIIMAGFMQGGLVPGFFIIASNSFPSRESSSSSIFILALNISNLLAKLFGLLIESYSQKVLMIFISICLLVSAILLKIVTKKHKQ